MNQSKIELFSKKVLCSKIHIVTKKVTLAV